jgi:UDP-N-acetylglucosamine--N-acetylmuramyl-(pentapeptide) pyrophosphoryl-undecaprenol N-acetylglucosamine transferase
MAEPRPLRILLVANDGFSAGHVTRTIAVAHALDRRARARGLSARIVLATTSEADTLLAHASFGVVRMPAPQSARRAGFSDSERRRLVRGVLRGTCEAFGPDLVVCDTFPSGPHGELAELPIGTAKRALIRRAVRDSGDAALTAGLAEYDLAILADDPGPQEVALPVPMVRVPPITLGENHEARERARRALGLPIDARAVLVASGGGGDTDAVKRATDLVQTIARLEPESVVVRAVGPLEGGSPPVEGRTRTLRVAPLQPFLTAFDGAIAAAGYNTAHELAKAGVPAALFAQPRPFDDQAARAARFSAAGLAFALSEIDDASVRAALAWMSHAPRTTLEAGGADRAADALLDLGTRGA